MLTERQIDALWPNIKLGLRNLWGRLSNDELDRTKGDFSAIAELVQDKYNEEPHDTREKLDHLLESFDNDTDKGLDPDKSSYMRSPVNEDWNPIH